MLVLPQYQLPVQTVDFFGGAFMTINGRSCSWRLRLSHLSAHDVDGKGSVTPVLSSHSSREFLEIMWQGNLLSNVLISCGIRAFIHQYSKTESYVALPSCLNWRILKTGSSSSLESFSVYLSTGGGPVSPSASLGLRFENERSAKNLTHIISLDLFYYYGAPWTSMERGKNTSEVKLQLNVHS
jgi:hypothetical protein